MQPIEPTFIHNFLPAKDSRNAQTILLLHGTGGSEDDLIDFGSEFFPHANLLSPRGKSIENGMARYFRRFAEGLFDEEDIKFRARELADFVKSASEAYEFDANKVIALGYSNGANIAAALLLLHPTMLRAAILFRPMLPLIPDTLPDLSKVQISMFIGTRDPIVPAEKADSLIELLEQAGSKPVVFKHEQGHSLTQLDLQDMQHWIVSSGIAEI